MSGLICTLLFLLSIAIFLRAILSWFAPRRDGPVAVVGGVLMAITDPVIQPVRRVLPPMRAGGMGIDLAPLVVLVGLMILRSIICH